MPRPPRVFTPGSPLHIHQRGNNRSPCFQGAEDYASYLHWLNEYARHYECALHAYVLMTNHVHMLVTPSDPTGPSAMMQSIGRKYVPRFNRKYSRTGTLWDGRFRSHAIESDRHLLTVYRYIDLNPVRARMVDDPAKYRWSSYHCNAFGREDARIRPHELFTALGKDQDTRCKAYRSLVKEVLDIEVIESIRACLASGKALRTPE